MTLSGVEIWSPNTIKMEENVASVEITGQIKLQEVMRMGALMGRELLCGTTLPARYGLLLLREYTINSIEFIVTFIF